MILSTTRWREGYILERGYWHGGIHRINADVEAKEGGHDFFRNNIRKSHAISDNWNAWKEIGMTFLEIILKKSHAKSNNWNDMEGQDMTF